MLNEELILEALGSVGDDLTEETRQALFPVKAAKKHGHTTWKMLLAAAVFISLLSVTAFATGWFGMSSRLAPTENPYNGEEALRFSVNDYAGTPTAEASREWTEYKDQYVSTHAFTNDNSFLDSLDEPEKSYSAIYGAFDREMLDRLLVISESSGIKLHTGMYGAPDYGDGLCALGVDDFIRGEADRSFKYIFEDGSFTVESYMTAEDTEILFTLIRGAKGVMENGYFILNSAQVFDEWEYVTESGISVNIAVNAWNELTKTVPVFILCDAGDYLVTIQTECPNKENIRAEAEKLAERFDYAALSGGEPDMSILEAPEPAQPHPVKPKEGLMTVKEFFETDEYKASAAFQRAFSDYYCAEVYKNENLVGAYADFYYGAFPAKDDKVNEILADVLAEFPGLAVPGEALGLFSNCPIEADKIRSFCWCSLAGSPPPVFVYEPVSTEEIFRMLGMESFAGEQTYTATAYDTGSFWLACGAQEYSIYYIPKGSFFPALRFALDENGEAWAYETACGEQVSAALGGTFQKPVMAYNYALYETDTAYVFLEFSEELGADGMEKLLDSIDFTKFNNQKPWAAERKIVPKYIDYAPLTIMKSNFRSSDEFLISMADTEAGFWTYDALMGKDTEGIAWEISGSNSVTLTDNGDGSCTLVTHGDTREAIKLTAKRGKDSFTVVIICENR